MASIADPLKYRGVFDYPHNRSANLLGPIRHKATRVYDPYSGEEQIEVYAVSAPEPGGANPPSTSEHVLKFLGWTGRGKRTRYSGNPAEGNVLSQKAAWMSEWLRKGQYAGAKREQQEAKKHKTSVGA
jgi:hypothetical protein